MMLRRTLGSLVTSPRRVEFGRPASLPGRMIFKSMLMATPPGGGVEQVSRRQESSRKRQRRKAAECRRPAGSRLTCGLPGVALAKPGHLIP